MHSEPEQTTRQGYEQFRFLGPDYALAMLLGMIEEYRRNATCDVHDFSWAATALRDNDWSSCRLKYDTATGSIFYWRDGPYEELIAFIEHKRTGIEIVHRSERTEGYYEAPVNMYVEIERIEIHIGAILEGPRFVAELQP